MRPSVVPAGIKLTGDVQGQGDLVVVGVVEGDVRVTGAVIVEATGSLRGRVEARMVVVRGVLVGDADATDTVRVEPGARMVGDARAPRVNIVEGALYRGRLEPTDDGVPRPARRTTASGATRSPVSRSSAGTASAPGTLASPVRPTSPGYTSSPGTASAPGTITSGGVVISPVPLATPMPAPPSPAPAPAAPRGTSPGTAPSPDAPRMPRLGRVAARTDGAPR